MSSARQLGPSPSREQFTGQVRRTSRPALRLSASLANVRQRLWFILGGAAIAWSLFTIGSAIALGVWIDLALNLLPELRVGVWLLALAAAITVLVRRLRRARSRCGDLELARRLDRVAGTGGEIHAGWELRQAPVPLRSESASLTNGLARLATSRAAQLASVVDVSRTSPVRPLVIAVGGCVLVALLMLVTVAAAPRLALTEALRFLDPFGDHPPYSPYVFHVQPEHAEVVYGSDLEISARVEGPPAEQVELVLLPPASQRRSSLDATPAVDVLPLFPRAQGEWRVSLSNVTAPVDYYLRVRRARSSVFPVSVRTIPQIADVRFELAPPAYSNLPIRRGPLESNGLDLLRDTRLKVFIRSNRPLSAGQLSVMGEQSQEIVLAPGENPQEVSGEFSVTADGSVDLSVVDVDGQNSAEHRSYPIRLIPDLHPLVRLTQPRAISFATPTAVIPVKVAAEDDFGLTKIELFRSLNASRALPSFADLPAVGPKRMEWSSELPLASYGLEPGDEIKLFATAMDNDPHAPQAGVNKPEVASPHSQLVNDQLHAPPAPIGKMTESSVVTLRIISQEEFDRLHRERVGMQSLSRKYEQVNRRLERLATEMEQLQQELAKQPADSPLAEALREKLEKLSQELAKESADIQKLSENRLPLDIDQELNPALKELADALRKMSEQAGEMAASPELSGQQAREGLQQQMDKLDQMRQRHQKEALEPLEWLKSTLAIKQQEAAFMELVRRQRDLADRLTALKSQTGQDDPAARTRMRSMEEEQRRNRESLSTLLSKIEEEAQRLPDDERMDALRDSALKFVEAVRGSEADQVMRTAETALAELDGPQSHEAANQAAEILESFLSQCNGMGGACESTLPKFAPGTSLSQALSNTLGALSPKSGMGNVGGGMAGEGGYNSRTANMDNMGLYGGMPLLEGGGLQETDNDASAAGLAAGGGPWSADGSPHGAGFNVRQSGAAMGGAEWGVPLGYRRQSGRYLQRLVDELDAE